MRQSSRKRVISQGNVSVTPTVPKKLREAEDDVQVQTKEEKTEEVEAEPEQMVIQSAEGRRQVVIRGQDGSMIIQDIGEQEHADQEVVTPHQGEQYIVTSEEGQVITGEEIVTEYQDPISTEDEEDVAGQEETESGSNDLDGPVDSKTVCHAYVIAKTVKEFRDLGRDMLRIHAENHGIEHASKLRLGELVREMVQHYNGVHNAGMEVSKLDMLKLNMLTLKKIKIDMRDKTPPPDITKMIPKNVVPIEEQVHHVYEKRPDICTVDIIVNNLKDMLALGTSILRPEASKHRVCNSSRKQKLQVVEELWEHYLKFHLKDTDVANDGNVKELVGEEYVEYRYQDSEGQECIVVSEGDLVAGEDIHTAAEEVTA